MHVKPKLPIKMNSHVGCEPTQPGTCPRLVILLLDTIGTLEAVTSQRLGRCHSHMNQSPDTYDLSS